MEPMEGIVNEFDCPLYVLSTKFELVASASIAAEVSFVHTCNDKGKFVTNHCPAFVERETVSVDNLHFDHDYSTNNMYMYCLNILLMNQ